MKNQHNLRFRSTFHMNYSFLFQFWQKVLFVFILLFVAVTSVSYVQAQNSVVKERRLKVSDYRNKMMAGWLGQMVGVGWGAPTEFRYQSRIIPEDEVPVWQPKMVNVWGQDDLYVEMTFLRSLEMYGFDVSMRQAGIDFANSKYQLWHANNAGRINLRNGIAPPDCGHPEFNKHADDIDYQIEADYSGLIAPGLPNTVIALGEKFGRLMNYGDGLYGGQFVGGMYAEAFFENDPLKIVKAGLKCIPSGSQYAEAVRDVIKWHDENPDDWQKTWHLINGKYHDNPEYRRFSCTGKDSKFDIDAKLNGAYVVMGLLYGNCDLDQTTIISMRCGQDSDCNPSSAAGVIFTTVGFDKLPKRFTSGLERDKKFSYTEYDFTRLIDVCEKLARNAVLQAGGRIEKNDDGEDIFVIPVKEPQQGKLEQCWEPGPIAGTLFTNKELPQLQWRWFFKLVLWVLLVLVLFLLKENRNLKVFWIVVPLITVLVLRAIFSQLIPSDFFKEGINPVLIINFSLGLCLLFLLGEKIARFKWVVPFGVSLVVFAAAGLIGMMDTCKGFYDGAAQVFFATYSSWALTLILGVTFTSLHCRKHYSNKRFLLFMLMWTIILKIILDAAVAAITWGFDVLYEYFIWILIFSFVMSIVQYLFVLPFWMLAFKNSIMNQRFWAVLKLPDGKINV